MKTVDWKDERYPVCSNCKTHLYNAGGGLEFDVGGFICAQCVARMDGQQAAVPVNVRRDIDDYIQFRETTAIAKYVLEQETLRTSTT